MAWLQSSFTNQQLIGESGGSNLRKGYKVGSLNKNADPDKSDTPLLHDTPLLSPESEGAKTDWFAANISSVEPKKQSILHSIASKPSFLSSSFFDRSGNSTKLKPQAGPPNASHIASGFSKKQTEDKKLLSDKKNTKPEFEADEDDESEDEWCMPHSSRGYQKVRSGAD